MLILFSEIAGLIKLRVNLFISLEKIENLFLKHF